MSISIRGFSRYAAAMLLAAVMCAAANDASRKVVWLDFDMRNIPEPKERPAGMYDNFFKAQMVEQTKQAFDVPRLVRAAAGKPKPAANVNAMDEVPDSSWYTNRHHLRRMTAEQLARGPNQSAGPDFTSGLITKAKTGGVTPGMRVKDARGDTYLIKFDDANYPELQSGAEVISTKILYAAGYNVPENYIAYIDPKTLEIDKDVETMDLAAGMNRAFTRDDLDEMLRRVAQRPDGRYRVLASKILPGKPKGPFPHVGLRRDDPNDLIPHEHRRELRGLRVIASWINHWDMKEENSLDMYVEEGGRKFLRHYLIDFGSSLGGGRYPTEYFRGREYAVDAGSIVKEMASLGLYKSADEKRGLVISPAVGMFTADDFDPGDWKTTYPVMAFDNMTDEDASWATRIIMSFTEEELKSIVETAEYSNRKDRDYMLRTLLERRALVARHWLRKADALAGISVKSANNGIAVRFRDVLLDAGLADRASTAYTYEIKGERYKSRKSKAGTSELLIDRRILGDAVEHGSPDTPIEIIIWTNRGDSTSSPVRLLVAWAPAREAPGLIRISRG